MASIVRKSFRVLGWGLAALVVVVIATFGFISTSSGKIWLAASMSRLASDPAAKTSVIISGIEGDIPWDMRISSIRLSDAGGEYASLRDLHLAWNPLALLRSHVDIHALDIAEIMVAREPLSGPETADQPYSFSLPDIPRITLSKLAINRIVLAPAIAGKQQVLAAEGGGSTEQYRLNVKTIEGPQTALALTAQWLPHSLSLQAVMEDAPGGVLLHMLKQPDDVRLHIALDMATDGNGVLQVNKAEGTLGTTSFSGKGNYALNTAAVNGDLTFSSPELQQFSALAQTALEGSAKLHISAAGPPEAIAITMEASLADFSMQGTAISQDSLHIEGVLNASQHTTSFTFNNDGVINNTATSVAAKGTIEGDTLTVQAMDVAYGDYRGHAKGVADIKEKSFDMEFKGTLPPLSILMPQLHAEGTAAVTARLKGTLDEFHAVSTLSVASEELQAEVKAEGEVAYAQQQFSGELNGDFKRAGHSFTLHAPVKADASNITVSDASLKGEGFSLSAQLNWAVEQALAEGSLALDAPDLRPLGTMLGQALSGRATLTAELTPHEHAQALKLSGNAHAIRLNDITLGNAELRAALQDAKTISAPLDMEFSAGPLVIGETRADSIAVTAKSVTENAVSVTASANGTSGRRPFSFQLTGGASRDAQEQIAIVLQTLKGVYERTPIELAAPARLTLTRNRSELSPLAITIAGGTVTTRGHMTAQALSGEFAAHRIALEKLPVAALPSGIGNMDITLSGNPAAPKAILASDVTIRYGQRTVNARMHGVWKENMLGLKAKAAMDKATFATDLTMAAPFSLSPFVLGLNGGTVMKGKATLDAEMEAFNAFLQAGGSRVGGHVSGSATLAGTLGAPEVKGQATLSEGQYYFQDAGICIKGMSAQVSSSGKQVTLKNLNARTPNGGSLQASAMVKLDGDKSVQGIINFDNYRLFCGGLASGTIDGKLSASGTTDAASLKGALTFPKMNVEIPGASSRRIVIPSVKTVRVDSRTGKIPVAARPAGVKEPLMLAVSVHVPNRLFVEGRGLNAEFAGDLTISGPATGPIVEGQFTTKRGSFELLDRKLKLTSGIIRFEGPIPPSPYLDVKAESVVNNTTISVGLSGPATKPVTAFTSSPSLPQDEILAMLLFNRSLSSLGPFQVAQLAQATAELAGYGGGPGILSKVQRKIGIDTLDVETDASNNVSVGAGKYITDKIYVGVTQGAKPESRAVTTEIELRPHISATSGVSSEGQQNIGLQWKYDY